MSDFQPILTGDHVQLRPIRAEDWDEMYAAGSDPLIWEGHPIKERYQEPLFRQFFHDALACGSALSILDRQTGRIIGSSRYHGHDPERRVVEIGWTFLARDYWGGAYNAEVKRLMTGHAFRYVDTVHFMVAETNLRSRGALAKIGAVWRGGGEERVINGITVQHMIYELDKPA